MNYSDGAMLRSQVYSACGVILMLRGNLGVPACSGMGDGVAQLWLEIVSLAC